MRILLLLTVLFLGYIQYAPAQGMHHKYHGTSSDDEKDDDDDMDMDKDDSMMILDGSKIRMSKKMSSALSLILPMTINGSGTSWQPIDAPVYGYMPHAGKWVFMVHGDIFVRYNKQDIGDAGHRGGSKIDAPDMLMGMAQRKIGKRGLLHFNAMLSTDALIAGGSGYPLLYQTGESWQNMPLVDRQHPHDLFSELSASYSYALSRESDVYAYVGYPGEPALGPTTFMHRVSGMFNPDAPIGHHWADATHITFGVATVGFRYGRFKLEGSSFTGREPDEDRYAFDQMRFDSWSGRLSYNPSDNWSLQASRSFIKSPEMLNPNEDIDRTTASATYAYLINKTNYITATALWGQNATAGKTASNSALAEATLKLNKLAVYGRYEWVQKSGVELNLTPMTFNIYKQYAINTITLGAGYDLYTVGPVTIAAGAQVSAYRADDALNNLYGKMPFSGEVYLHIYPKRVY